jgi:amidase
MVRADELALLPAIELIALMRSRKVSPVEIIESARAAHRAFNPLLNAIVTETFDAAMEEARRAERQLARDEDVGPLHGLPLGVKDSVETAGVRTTYGSPLFRDHVPLSDALHVARLRAAGAILVGKTNTPEFEAGINTRNPVFGQTLNPWNVDLGCGGSSGGSAVALATGMCALADGTDHGGSIRIPASVTGVVGLRPSPGRVPLHPSKWVFDPFGVPGPLARSARDVALMLKVMAGPDPRVPISLTDQGTALADSSRAARSWRVAWTPDLGGLFAVDPEVARVAEAAARRFTDLGCTIEYASPDWTDAREIIEPLRAFRTAIVTEDLRGRADSPGNPFLQQFMERAARMSLSDVAHAERRRSAYWERTAAFFSRFDLLILPATQWTAFPKDQEFPPMVGGRAMGGTVEAILATYAVTIAGLPALSIPCGLTAEGLPVGLQIVGGWRADAEVLRAGIALEDLVRLSRRPPMVAAADRFG